MKVLLVHCHPLADSFVAAMRDRAVAGLEGGGHDVRVLDLYAERFDPELGADELASYLTLTRDPDSIEGRSAALLRWCDALVLVYPTWWSGQPAMLKGWFDRILVPGVAFDIPARGSRPRPLLRNIRRIVAVTSHGSAKWVNVVEGEGGKRLMRRALRLLCHPRCRTTWLSLYKIDRASAAERDAFLVRVEERLRRL